MHTCQPPEYKNLEMSRNLCIVRMSLKTMSRNNLRKSPKKQSERPGDLMKNLETTRKTGRVGRYDNGLFQKKYTPPPPTDGKREILAGGGGVDS